jgi:hypothetical protein
MVPGLGPVGALGAEEAAGLEVIYYSSYIIYLDYGSNFEIKYSASSGFCMISPNFYAVSGFYIIVCIFCIIYGLAIIFLYIFYYSGDMFCVSLSIIGLFEGLKFESFSCEVGSSFVAKLAEFLVMKSLISARFDKSRPSRRMNF